MKIDIIGAGFTGLVAGLRLLQKGHSVYIFEKEMSAGGLASGFKKKSWDWALEKSYHHWFTNDDKILALAKELNYKVVVKKPHTDILINDKILPLDNGISLILFSGLPLLSRIRVGLSLVYFKILNNYKRLENKLALKWIEQWMGKKATKLIWEPLFYGKFGSYKNTISLSWFWARIKKRTASLAYPQKGFKNFTDEIVREIEKLGGEINFKSEVKSINSSKNSCSLQTPKNIFKFDKIICTSPSPVFTGIAPNLPQKYVEKIGIIQHLDALNLILVLKKSFLKNTYWLNIARKEFPFLVLVEHTNFINPTHYNNQHIVYIGNYLPKDHPYLKMTGNQLLKLFNDYLLKLNPNFQENLISVHKFVSSFAQPIVALKHSRHIPKFQTPLKNIYLANLDMVYPWDRGTNYAADLGEKIAKLLTK